MVLYHAKNISVKLMPVHTIGIARFALTKIINLLIRKFLGPIFTWVIYALFQDLINLAPRKPDWDLKRDVAKKLEKLERRTQRAIAQLIRE